jgi:xylulose-5-phosphate/fructose-6-phosphate phosphoketolase
MNTEQTIKALDEYTRLTNYLSAAQIFLSDNFFLDRPLEHTDIKKRLLGHWGTCPGINLVYAQVNRLIIQNPHHDFMMTVGPGHGFPAFQSNIFLEGSLSRIYPEKTPYKKIGVEHMISHFSVPYGYPSHLNPEAPGVILEGGELGYSLAVAGGSILDNKKLINICIIGDGEAETGTIASSWHINKFISPTTDGAVLPVLHLNGYKISGPTIFGRMADTDIQKYFEALGWEPLFIEAETTIEFHTKALPVFDSAYKKISTLQKTYADTQGVPLWPVIIMRTPKGMTATDHIGTKQVVGNNLSHQIVFDYLSTNQTELSSLQNWLDSYRIHELISFDSDGTIILSKGVQSLIPEPSRAIGMSPYAHGDYVQKAKTPDFADVYTAQEYITELGHDSMTETGDYMKRLITMGNEFRLFSPDETYSNKLQDIFKSTQRVWQLPNKSHDTDFGRSGRVIEMLSENVLFGMMWGYTLTGRYGYFPSYEAFAQIVSSMADQYVKFIKVAKETTFRKPVPAMNIILSSLWERQDHNGFSHQNPSFISTNLDRDRDISSIYFPADKNLMKLAMEKTMHSYNALNIIVCGKKMKRTWLTMDEARKQADDGIMIWNRYSDDNPDVVLVTAGDYITEEVMAGMKLLRAKLPELKIRLVNIFTLDVLNAQDSRFTKEEILDMFLTRDKPIICNYHGYPDDIKKLLFDYHISSPIIINGYEEHGSTTSPFDMKARNGLSRYHLLRDVTKLAHNQGVLDSATYHDIAVYVEKKLTWEKEYITTHLVDPDSTNNWEID